MDLNEILSKYNVFTKEVTKSGGQKVISIPSYKKDIKEGDEAFIIMKPKRKSQ